MSLAYKSRSFKCHCDVAVNVMSSGKFCRHEFSQLIPPLLDFCSVHNFDLVVLKSIATKQVLEWSRGLWGFISCSACRELSETKQRQRGWR